ncbi:MAG TPA: alanine racemase [Flavipsychrobacter sp.]|nr:alanine racemase [Flavipsychrobacter sp.]
MKSSSRIILDKAATENNWNFLRSYFDGIKISAVVKGNAYGHGIPVYVPLAQNCGVNHFSVFNAHEAYVVQQFSKPGTTILIMGDMEEEDLAWAIENGIEFYLFDFERMQKVIELAARLKKQANIHIEVETGMYRTGFDADDISALIEILKQNRGALYLKGLCTHFAGAESRANFERIEQQKSVFKSVLSMFEKEGMKPEMVHTCCSAAAIRLPDMHYDMLRIGIMQYGFWPNAETFSEFMQGNGLEKSPLRRIINWESHVMSVKEVPANSYVGYGSSYYTHYRLKLAIVPVGYGYGFTRAFSNVGVVLINNIRAGVVGTVNMNCIAVDITHIDNVKTDDPVVLIGRQGAHEITVASFGEISNQMNYELLTRLPLDIPRVCR